MGTNMGDGTNFNSWIDGLSDDQVTGFLKAICKWPVQPARTETIKRKTRALEFIDLISAGKVALSDVKAWLKKLGDSASSADEVGGYYGSHSHG